MHRFAIGELVYYRPTLRGVASPGLYDIVLLLPDDGSAPQYRIRSATEAFERVAREFELKSSWEGEGGAGSGTQP